MTDHDEQVSKIETFFGLTLIVLILSIVTALVFRHGLEGIYFLLLGACFGVATCLLGYQHRGAFYRFVDDLREELEVARRYGEPPYKTDQIIDETLKDDGDASEADD